MADNDFHKETQQDHAIRIALLEQSVEGIKNGLLDISKNVKHLVFTVISAVFLAVVQFIVKGGLNG